MDFDPPSRPRLANMEFAIQPKYRTILTNQWAKFLQEFAGQRDRPPVESGDALPLGFKNSEEFAASFFTIGKAMGLRIVIIFIERLKFHACVLH